jgi:hypothetical protein
MADERERHIRLSRRKVEVSVRDSPFPNAESETAAVHAGDWS